MASEPQEISSPDAPAREESVEMPQPTAAPFVLSLGLILLAAGVVMGAAFFIVGAVILATGLGLWIAHLLPGQGHCHEPLVAPELRSKPVTGETGTVEQLEPGRPGYRMRLPEKVHPISAGIKGGILGGFVMPVPALAYGLISGHGLWYPVNLLAGMVVPGVDAMKLNQFHFSLLLVGIVIHATISVVFGLLYGVVMPTLPPIAKPLAWGGLLMPMLWTAVTFSLMGIINPVLHQGVHWSWFILSQFIFGLVAAVVVMRLGQTHPVWSGLLGGIVGGLLMTIPAILWGMMSGHGMWYPVNLMAGMLLPEMSKLPLADREQFHVRWFLVAIVIHAVLSAGFGLIYGILLPRLRTIPGPLAWGGLLLPLLWTATSYGLMGVVNPTLQKDVDWPWFIVSQFVFGVVAAVVVVRSEKIAVPPVGGATE